MRRLLSWWLAALRDWREIGALLDELRQHEGMMVSQDAESAPAD